MLEGAIISLLSLVETRCIQLLTGRIFLRFSVNCKSYHKTTKKKFLLLFFKNHHFGLDTVWISSDDIPNGTATLQ